VRHIILAMAISMAVNSSARANPYSDFNPEAPKVSASVSNHYLHITVPEGTLHGSVTFRIHGFNVDKRVMSRHARSFRWEGNTLTVDMRPFHERHHLSDSGDDHHLWVWGHMMNGEALLQVVHVAH